MTARESPLLHAIRAALAATGRVMLWRNNTGVDTDRGVRYGLGIGGADLVGLLLPSGRFVGFEVKAPTGRLSSEQQLWHAAVRSSGGFVAVVHDAVEALEALDRASQGKDR